MRYAIKGFITYEPNKYAGTAEVSFKTYDPRQFSHYEGVVVREETIEVEIPDDFDPRADMVQTLEKQRDKVRAEYAARVKALDDRINSLLAIENHMKA